jgi:hypothetical protein
MLRQSACGGDGAAHWIKRAQSHADHRPESEEVEQLAAGAIRNFDRAQRIDNAKITHNFYAVQYLRDCSISLVPDLVSAVDLHLPLPAGPALPPRSSRLPNLMPLLSPRDVEAIHSALDLAYQGWASCDQVIRRHGEVRPFSRIREAERRHIHELWRLFIVHGLPIPTNPRGVVMPVPDSLPEACGMALEQERTRLQRCRQLLAVAEGQQLQTGFRSLAEAREARYLPAYERCGQCINTQAGGCPDGPSRPASAPPRRCLARSHQDWQWAATPEQ